MYSTHCMHELCIRVFISSAPNTQNEYTHTTAFNQQDYVDCSNVSVAEMLNSNHPNPCRENTGISKMSSRKNISDKYHISSVHEAQFPSRATASPKKKWRSFKFQFKSESETSGPVRFLLIFWWWLAHKPSARQLYTHSLSLTVLHVHTRPFVSAASAEITCPRYMWT